jgi:glycosyltransferase involved in cell wall biosynthesis
MMRIGFIEYGLDRPVVGITRYILELSNSLRDFRESLDIILLTTNHHESINAIPDGKRASLPLCRLLPGLVTLGNYLIPKIAKDSDLDIVHDPTGVSPFLFGAGPAGVVATVHDVFPWSCPGNSSLLDSLIYKYWLPNLLNHRVNSVITVSNQSKEDIQRYLSVDEDKITVIPYGIGSQFKVLSSAEIKEHVRRRFGFQGPYLLYVGQLTLRKNIRRALEAFAGIHTCFPKLRFVLAGPSSWKKTAIESAVDEFGINGKVYLTGPLTDIELPALYNGAELFIFPSLYEGFGLPPLEAMACGTPVITSNTSSLPEVAGDAALLVDPYNVDEIAAAMRRVLSDPDLAAELRTRGLERARQFSWQRTARETIAVYEKVLNGEL